MGRVRKWIRYLIELVISAVISAIVVVPLLVIHWSYQFAHEQCIHLGRDTPEYEQCYEAMKRV